MRQPPRMFEVVYISVVSAAAVAGFAAGSTPLILLAVALSLPIGLLGLISYYVAYGLLALIPGANPDSSSGTAVCSVGSCTSTSTGDTATWFTAVTGILGIVLLVAAAVTNVILLRVARRGRAPLAADPQRS